MNDITVYKDCINYAQMLQVVFKILLIKVHLLKFLLIKIQRGCFLRHDVSVVLTTVVVLITERI